MVDRQILSGGREGKIVKVTDHVVRPGNAWTPYVHDFLRFMDENGFVNIPKPYGMNAEGQEIVSFVEGDVYSDSLPDMILSDEVLIDVAKLLRCYHDIGEDYIQRLAGNEEWMLPKKEPEEVMCHGDFAPYNITFVEGVVHGIIDFDTLHPGPRLWDIAYAVYRWIPFVSPMNPDYRGNLEEQIRRLKLFVDTYGLCEDARKHLPKMMVERIQSLVSYMKREAENGNKDVLKNIEDGHMKMYLDDIQYICENEQKILESISL